MNTVIKGCKTIEEFKKKQQKLEKLAELAYKNHKSSVETWNEGEPIKAWYEDDSDICVEYESGKYWHYTDLDMPFITWCN